MSDQLTTHIAWSSPPPPTPADDFLSNKRKELGFSSWTDHSKQLRNLLRTAREPYWRHNRTPPPPISGAVSQASHHELTIVRGSENLLQTAREPYWRYNRTPLPPPSPPIGGADRGGGGGQAHGRTRVGRSLRWLFEHEALPNTQNATKTGSYFTFW